MRRHQNSNLNHERGHRIKKIKSPHKIKGDFPRFFLIIKNTDVLYESDGETFQKMSVRIT